MPHEKFNLAHIDRLNDPARLEDTPPAVLWEALGNPTPQTIIDVGAGTGLFACQFAGLSPEATVYAIDIEPAMVRWMLEHRSPALCSRLQPLLGKESAVPLTTGEADLVVMMNLHHELVDPHASYREALRLTRIGGQLLVVDYAPDGQEPGPPHHIRVAADQIADVARAVGFDEVTVHPPLPRHSLITARKPVICSL